MLTKKELYKRVKGIAPYERYHGGYILADETGVYDCKNQRELVEKILKTLKENPNQLISVAAFGKENGEWKGLPPVTVVEYGEFSQGEIPGKNKGKKVKERMKAIKERYENKYLRTVQEIKNIDLWSKFVKFNKKYFNQELELETLKWSKRLTRSAGNCSRSKSTIKLSVDYHRKYPEDIDNTLVHEMIHLVASGHKGKFKREMQRVNRIAGERLVTINSKERARANHVAYCPTCDEVIGERSRLTDRMREYGYCPDCETNLNWIDIET